VSKDRLQYASSEQLRYARVLDWGMKLGLFALTAGCLAYVFEFVPAHVPIEQLPAYWSLPAQEYLQRTASPKGWDWLPMLANGDILPIAGIAILSGVSGLCFLVALIPAYLRQRDWAYLAIAVVQILVLVLAASGLLDGGH
jgi:hypothetical protein